MSCLSLSLSLSPPVGKWMDKVRSDHENQGLWRSDRNHGALPGDGEARVQ